MSIIRKIFAPFLVIPYIAAGFILWILFAVLLGQLGVILSIVFDLYKGEIGLSAAFVKNMDLGNFYTVGIALVASYVSQLLIEMILEKDIRDRGYKGLSLGISIFILVIMAGLYSFVAVFSHSNKIDYWVQAILYLISLGLSAYIFCIGFMHLKPVEYGEKENSIIKKIEAGSHKIDNDGRGISV